MEYNEFENQLLSHLKNDDNEYLNTVTENERLIQTYLQNTEKPVHIKSLVDGINDIIVNKNTNFVYIENVLKYPSMKDVLAQFRESEIIIKACQKENFTALKWLIKMDINPYVFDENGMISLMYAAKEKSLFFVVEYLLNISKDLVNIVDNNGNNVLFYAVNNPLTLDYLLKFDIDIYKPNNSNENFVHFAFKNSKDSYVVEHLCKEWKTIIQHIDLNGPDQTGRTPLMYLLENENYPFFITVLQKLRYEAKKPVKTSDYVYFNINYRNILNNESIISIFIKKYYEMCCKKNYREVVSKKRDLITTMGMMFALIISYPGFDINMPIDDDDNTPIMFFLMIEDIVAVNFILSYCENVDLGIKNKKGINASILTLKIKNENVIMQQLIKHKTFDSQFIDQYNNNILVYSILMDNAVAFTEIINEHPKTLEYVNNKKEDAIIIATKLGYLEKIKSSSFLNINLNHQDGLGNTALFYAVNMRNIYDINLLAYYHADLTIKNNQGISPMDQAVQIGEEKLIKYMENPKIPYKMKEKLEKGKSKGLFSKKNSSIDKTDDYIKNYQVNNFKEEYKSVIENCNSNYNSPLGNSRERDINNQFALVIYVMLDRITVYSMNKVYPLDIALDERLRKYIYYKYGSTNSAYINEMLHSLTSKPLEETTNLYELFRFGEPTVIHHEFGYRYNDSSELILKGKK